MFYFSAKLIKLPKCFFVIIVCLFACNNIVFGQMGESSFFPSASYREQVRIKYWLKRINHSPDNQQILGKAKSGAKLTKNEKRRARRLTRREIKGIKKLKKIHRKHFIGIQSKSVRKRIKKQEKTHKRRSSGKRPLFYHAKGKWKEFKRKI